MQGAENTHMRTRTHALTRRSTHILRAHLHALFLEHTCYEVVLKQVKILHAQQQEQQQQQHQQQRGPREGFS